MRGDALNDKALIQILVAMRALTEAALFSLTGPPPDVEEVPICEHPPESRLNLSTMGGPSSWQCRLCGHTQTD